MSCHQINLESIRAMRKALITGLASYGEIERLSDKWECLELVGETPNDELKPVHPTGNADTVGDFASALAYLDIFESELGAA